MKNTYKINGRKFIYEINGKNYRLKDQLSTAEQNELGLTLNILLSTEPANKYSQQLYDRIKDIYKTILISENGDPLPEGFDFEEMKESVIKNIIKDSIHSGLVTDKSVLNLAQKLWLSRN